MTKVIGKPVKLAAGLMSGTSMDGVDAALIKTDGYHAITPLAHFTLAYSESFKHLLKATEYTISKMQNDLIEVKKHFKRCLDEYFEQVISLDSDQLQSFRRDILQELPLASFDDIRLQDVIDCSSRYHIQAVLRLVEQSKLSISDIDVIGYHGQTFYHAPEQGASYQATNIDLFVKTLGVTTVYDFRHNDIAHGGQGAPFAPIYHQALAVRDNLYPVAVINCGGISNITLIYGPGEADVIGYDCGPGNVLIDKWIRSKRPPLTMDKDGQFGLKGTLQQDLIVKLFDNCCKRSGFFERATPKSLDSYDFQLIPELEDYCFEDVCTTLEHFTSDVIIKSLESLHEPIPTRFILCGGGWANPVIRQSFTKLLHQKVDASVLPSGDVSWNSTCLEAEVFAYLAVRSQLGLALSYPSTTGVSKPVTGGRAFVPAMRDERGKLMMQDTWRPSASTKHLILRSQLLEKIRHFFYERDFTEVETPILSRRGNTYPHIESLSTRVQTCHSEPETFYLHTSPEFAMKRLLAAEMGPIFQICKAFRDEVQGRYHHYEFTMLEWYQPGFDYKQLMQQVSEFLQSILTIPDCQFVSYQEIFEQTLSINPHQASIQMLKQVAKAEHINIDYDGNEKDTWLDLLLSHCIEPTLGTSAPVFLYDYPASQAALATIRQDNIAVAERFEVYYKGIELANGFNELTCPDEQLARFQKDVADRNQQNKPPIPIDEHLISALKHGMPKCSGVALGIDRLCMLAIGADSISDVISFVSD